MRPNGLPFAAVSKNTLLPIFVVDVLKSLLNIRLTAAGGRPYIPPLLKPVMVRVNSMVVMGLYIDDREKIYQAI